VEINKHLRTELSAWARRFPARAEIPVMRSRPYEKSPRLNNVRAHHVKCPVRKTACRGTRLRVVTLPTLSSEDAINLFNNGCP